MKLPLALIACCMLATPAIAYSGGGLRLGAEPRIRAATGEYQRQYNNADTLADYVRGYALTPRTTQPCTAPSSRSLAIGGIQPSNTRFDCPRPGAVALTEVKARPHQRHVSIASGPARNSSSRTRTAHASTSAGRKSVASHNRTGTRLAPTTAPR